MNNSIDLVKMINEAIMDCKNFGCGSCNVNGIEVHADWEQSESDPAYDVIRVSILENNVVRFSYTAEGTETEN